MNWSDLTPPLVAGILAVFAALVPWIVSVLIADRKKRDVEAALSQLRLDQLRADEAVLATRQEHKAVEPTVDPLEPPPSVREVAAAAVAKVTSNEALKASAVAKLLAASTTGKPMDLATASTRIEAAVGRMNARPVGGAVSGGMGGAGGGGGKGGDATNSAGTVSAGAEGAPGEMGHPPSTAATP